MTKLLETRLSKLSRRAFLKAGAAAGGGFMIGWVPHAAKAGGDAVFAPDAFIRLDSTGKVAVVMPVIEMGQGTYTSLPMVIAEEMDLDMGNVTFEHSPAGNAYGNPMLGGVQITGGSNSIRGFYMPFRQAGATARRMLMTAAAQELGVEEGTLTTEPGFVVHARSGRKTPYGELAQAASALSVPAGVALKDPSTFRIIGNSVKRLDTAKKVNGAAKFGIDVQIPGMKVAVVAASPVFGGTLTSVDEASALQVAGVRQIAKLGNAVAVIADHYWAARQGLDVAAPEFDDGPHASVSTADIVAALAKASEKQGAVAKSEGDAASVLAASSRKAEATYEQPFLAHATMEPINCTVHVKPDSCDIWVGTQVQGRAQAIAAEALGMQPEQVTIHNHLLGGGFGRRLEVDYIQQAALIARQSPDPVKVVWSREEDIQHDMYRPYYYDRISAALGEDDMPAAWTHRIVGSSIVARYFPDFMKDGVDPDAVDGAAENVYGIKNFFVDYVREEPPGIPTAFWRGVGPTRNIFVIESFLDELAALAGKDPIAYRRALLAGNSRALGVIDKAAEMSDWGTPLGPHRGRGVSFQHVFGTFMAQVAEVTVSERGEVHVDRVLAAVDCGLPINPDTIEAQLQSGIIFGITAVLHGEITLQDGRVEQSNFHDYEILRIDKSPKIEVAVIQSSEAPGGIGEPGTSGIIPAVANAVFAATGVRVRKLPFKAEDLRSR